MNKEERLRAALRNAIYDRHGGAISSWHTVDGVLVNVMSVLDSWTAREAVTTKELVEDRDAWRKRAEEAEEGLARRIFEPTSEAALADPTPRATEERLPGERK